MRDKWTAAVQQAALSQWIADRPPYTTEVGAAIVYYYRDETNIDVDNMGKLILDALKGVIIEDDGLITQLTSRKTDQNAIIAIRNPSEVLASAIGTYDSFVYVVIGNPPNHEEIPL